MSTFVLYSLLAELYTCHHQQIQVSSEPDMHLDLSQLEVKLTESTMFLTIVEYVSVSIHPVRYIKTRHPATDTL